MSEQNLITQLRSLTGTPVEPPEGFREDLWLRIENEADTRLGSGSQRDDLEVGNDFGDVSVVPKPTERRQRNPLWVAAAAFALVIGTGMLVWWLLSPGSGVVAGIDPALDALSVPGPVELAVGDVLWPAHDMTGTPSSAAEAFAREVLGWNQTAASETERGTCLTFPSRNAEVCSETATAVTLSQSGVASLQVIMNTIGGSEKGQLWAVVQVGAGYTTDRLQPAPDSGTRIPLSAVEDAATVDIIMRIAFADDVVEVTGDVEDLEAGYVETNVVPDPEEVLSVLIRYRDTNGHVITAVGGPWNVFYEWPEPEPVGPEVTIAEGRFEGSDQVWRLSAFQATDGTLCIRLEGMGCVGDIPPGAHLGAVLGTTAFGVAEDDRWCVYGNVVDAAAVEIYLSDGSRTAAPIFTDSDFDVDFYAYCAFGSQPADKIVALDSSDNIIDTTLIRLGG